MLRWLVVFLAGVMLLPLKAVADEAVDIELVLAIDVSGSVDAGEQELQRTGLVEAFQDPAVVAAIEALPAGLAVAVVAFAGEGQVRTVVGWRQVSDGAACAELARAIGAAFPIVYPATGKTAIGDALAWSREELGSNAYRGRAKIDVSGDGRSSHGAYPGPERDLAVAAGITINGLVIANEEPYLAEYFRRTVIGGPGAFVMTVRRHHDQRARHRQ